jgi:hypothetical protein
MKFKMQDKQNQLIERITEKHLVVGVDIAQQFHVARAVKISVGCSRRSNHFSKQRRGIFVPVNLD